MTTRDDLYRLVDQLHPETLDDAAAALRQYTPVASGEPPYPASVGVLTEAPADLSTHVDDYLAENVARLKSTLPLANLAPEKSTVPPENWAPEKSPPSKVTAVKSKS